MHIIITPAEVQTEAILTSSWYNFIYVSLHQLGVSFKRIRYK